MAGWSSKKREAVETAFYEFLDRCFINSKDAGRVCLGASLFDGQVMFITSVFDALENDIHKIFVLKSRQLGISTIARALSIFLLGVHSGLKGAIVFDTDNNKNESRAEIEIMIDDLPSSLKFPRIIGNNRTGLTLSNNSKILFMSAGVRKSKTSGTLGRSVGLSLAHLCLDPDTPVIVSDGRVVPIKNVPVGETVLTHTGQKTVVIANSERLNDIPAIKITPWLGAPVLCTANHKIPTQRGLLPAAELRKDDFLIMPLRTITNEVVELPLPKLVNRVRERKNKTSVAFGSVQLNEEIGFAVGYFLAEGSITYQRRGKRYYDYPSGIVFSRHRQEQHYSDRAIAALRQYTTGHQKTTDTKNSLTTTENIYGAAIARWMAYNFGMLDNKKIPDAVFSYGKEFCRGLLCGLLSGDGSKTEKVSNGKYLINDMRVTTTRASIAMQLRDLAAALGYGWAACDYSPAGVKYGRNCKAIWTVRWAGYGAGQLRKLIGLSAAAKTRACSNKSIIIGSNVYIKIRNISPANLSVVRDLAVAHPDHTFRTVSMSVGNSELCSYDNDEGLEAFEQSLSDVNPDRLYIYESTARGFNRWWEMWKEAREDPNHCVCLFLGWWSKPSQRIDRTDPDWELYGVFPPTERETEKIKQVKEQYKFDVTMEQLAWVRRKMDPTAHREGDANPEYEGNTTRIQEQPWTEEEAFQQTGTVFFPAEKLTDLTNKWASNNYKTYMFITGVEFVDMAVIKAENSKSIDLKVWEEPDTTDGVYCIACDPAYGENEQNCRSSIQVLRCYADGIDQVAEYASPIHNTRQLAWIIASLLGWYGGGNAECRYILELAGGGTAAFNELRSLRLQLESGYQPREVSEKGLQNVFANVRTYIYTRPDSMGAGQNYHFKTNAQLKVTIMNRLRDFVTNGMLHVRSLDAIEEMRTIAQEGDSIKAPGSMKDDRVLALALGVYYWETTIRKPLMVQRRTREAEAAKKRLSIVDQVQLFSQNQLQDFFAQKQKIRFQAAMQASRQRWRYGR